MSGALQPVDGAPQAPRCAFCGREAAGPCASCKRMVCGRCSTLTEGGVKVWAICLDCDRKGKRSLSRAWAGLVLWLLAALAALAIVTALLGWLSRR